MNLNPRTPVIIGAAQVTDRISDPSCARTPLELMEDAAHSAAVDAQATQALSSLDTIAVVNGMWRYPNPGKQLAQKIGSPGASSLLSGYSGHSPQSLLNELGQRIQSGKSEISLLVGGEAALTYRKAKKLGVDLRSDVDQSLDACPLFETPLAMGSDHEISRGLRSPIVVYPLIESALRAHRGETFQQHRQRLGNLWAGFNKVAVGNPHAAHRTLLSAEEITTPTTENRFIGFPYPLTMNANNTVDQSSAVLVTSAERAMSLGVPKEQWVFLHAGTEAHDSSSLSERKELHRSPAIRLAGRKALELAGLGATDLTHLELYSCFPSVVQVSLAELEISHDRPLTVTGGLTFAGGPLSNYSGQAIAALVAALREEPGHGFLHANGGYITKHAFGVYSTQPPTTEGFRFSNEQPAVDALPNCTGDPDFSGPATIEACTAMFDRSGQAEHGVLAMRSPAGARVWGTTNDPGFLQAITSREMIGVDAELNPDGQVSI
ncbi:MAG: acetyl-CoA acetyltransferase [Acidimicrobiales bacterium]